MRESSIKTEPIFKVVIPARYGSQRLPGKPLLEIHGKPMVQHVYQRAVASGADQVVVATDDKRIEAVARSFTDDVCMTSTAHASGTDRIAEVAAIEGWPAETIVVNLQGDEPLMPPVLLGEVATALIEHPAADVSTLAVPLGEPEQLFDTHTVKVVTDHAGYALYFSRATIPWQRDRFATGDTPMSDWLSGMHRHLGLYAYRAGFLSNYATLEPAPIEQMEALEQLRVLWHGGRIAVGIASETPPGGVDTAGDLERVMASLA
jgi:3-deoxy-manno-octulosonate cytidylyltransferase (CMP-KDO synthetase)